MSAARTTWAFVAVQFRSLARDRTALFFMVALPVIIIVVVGSAFGAGERVPVAVVVDTTPAVVLVDGTDSGSAAQPVEVAPLLEARLADAEGVAVERWDDLEEARAAVRAGELAAVVVVPAVVLVPGGGPATVGFVSRGAEQSALVARVAVQGALEDLTAAVGAAEQVAVLADEPPAGFVAAALDEVGAAPSVEVVDVGGDTSRDLSQFSLTAPQNLVLFTFITSLSGGASLVVVRRSGVLRRIAASPVSTGRVLLGLTAAWFVLALGQSVLILVIGAVAFAVEWGDPLAVTLLTTAFAAVGASAGLLVGALGRDEDKVASSAPIVSIVLGALGGCMVPLEVFPPAVEAVAHVVPQYWAITGWQELVFDGGGVAAIAGPLVVLAVFAVVLWGAATVVLRRQLAAG